jgi:hypothetical protein
VRSVRASDAALLALLVAGGALALAACANLDGLTGGAPPGGSDAGEPPPSDGAPPRDAHSVTDAPGTDSRDAAPPTDASLPAEDAPPDAGAPVDGNVPPPVDANEAGPTGTFCQQQSPAPTFCADFDTTLTGGFSSVNQSNGTLVADAVHYVSSPHSLSSTTAATAANGMAQASVDYDAPLAGSHVHLEYQLRVGTLDAQANVVAGGIALITNGGAGPDAYHIFLVLSSSSGAYIEEAKLSGGSDVYQNTPLSASPTALQFVRVQFDVVLPSSGGPAPTATVHFDNNVVLNAHPLYGGGASGPVEISVGAEVYPSIAIGQNQLDVDNVLLNVSQ